MLYSDIIDSETATKVRLFGVDLEQFASIEELNLFFKLYEPDLWKVIGRRAELCLFPKAGKIKRVYVKKRPSDEKRVPKTTEQRLAWKYAYNRTRYLKIKSGQHIPKPRT